MIKSTPIKSVSDIQVLKSYFAQERTRDYILFVLAINVPLKIQDILEMKCEDLIVKDNRFVFMVNGYSIYLNSHDSNVLSSYIQSKSKDDYLFVSIKTKSPLTRQQFHRILSKAASEIGCTFSIGAQALKKTFAYHAFVQGIHIYDLMHLLGHQTKSETYQFMDIEPPDYKKIELQI
ncbi:tyrosine-type recombinase/integrase [Macrococcoides caseolyticum]|uniref:tyrosine-type recombinase/integrase n=1 Tax=Macrococcoides caseolyticum TaxID=69966 RepID=UPI001F2F1197|nr:tyrosine-type recombinase/integrase [Macrococcus caseolyticus]MCE4956528.1 tyrosine-type recombinase/integrase [Macrococcus caseolyticus]